MVIIYYSTFTSRFTEKFFNKLLFKLSANDRKKITQFKKWEFRQNRLIGRHLLHLGISELVDKNALKHIKYNAYGKPYLKSNIAFNLSYTDKCAVCAISDQKQVGIDVEKISNIDFSLYKDYMHSSEWDTICNSNNKLKAFFFYWTQKEAVIKADGRGLRVPLKRVQIKNEIATLDGLEWYLHQINIAGPFVCHLALNRIDGNISKNFIYF